MASTKAYAKGLEGFGKVEMRPYVGGHDLAPWLVEFEREPDNPENFKKTVYNHLREKNIYYDDLITGGILQPLKITSVQRHAFKEYMKSIGKLGGQNKVPRLSNDRKLVDELLRWRK